jgi:CRP-like cAMP-binding protein
MTERVPLCERRDLPSLYVWACRFANLSKERRVILDVDLSGDVIGLDNALGARPLEVFALTSVSVEAISAEDALTELMADLRTALYFAWLLGKQQRRADRLLAAISCLDARGRLAMMLLDFYMRLQRRRLITGATYNLPMAQSQIGQYLGLTVVHINRILRVIACRAGSGCGEALRDDLQCPAAGQIWPSTGKSCARRLRASAGAP